MDLNKRFNASFLSRLPLELLNFWSTLDLLQLACHTDVDPTFKKRATVDLLVFLLEAENFGFCGLLACRHCYRLASSRQISPPAVALIEYIKVFLLYVRNDGAASHSGISNTFVKGAPPERGKSLRGSYNQRIPPSVPHPGRPKPTRWRQSSTRSRREELR